MDNTRAQAERFGARMVDDDIVSVDLSGDIKLLTDSEGTVPVIVATGSGYRKLSLPQEDDLSGRGVSWYATCDRFFFRDRDIVVVGGGHTAMEEATVLTRFARDDKISFAFDSEIAEIKDKDGMPTSVVLRDVFTGATRDLDVTGLFITIGHDPRAELFKGQDRLQRRGLYPGRHPLHAHQPARSLRRWRRRRQHLPAGHHRRLAPVRPPPWTPSGTSPLAVTVTPASTRPPSPSESRLPVRGTRGLTGLGSRSGAEAARCSRSAGIVTAFAGKAVAHLFRLDAPAGRAIVFTGATQLPRRPAARLGAARLPDHTAGALTNFAVAVRMAGDAPGTVTLGEQAMRSAVTALGPRHPWTLGIASTSPRT